MNFCDTCVYWDFTYDTGTEKMGTCSNNDLEDKLAITDETDLGEGTLFTAATFGCIYHEKKDATNAVCEIKIPKQ